MTPSLFPLPIDPKQLTECIGMAGEDFLGRIIDYQGKEFSYETASLALSDQLSPFRSLIESCISNASSLSGDTKEKRTLQRKASSLNEGMIILSASLHHRLQLVKTREVDPTEAFPFKIPISALKVALHISSLFPILELGQIVHHPSLPPHPPIKIIQYGLDTYVVKTPLLSTDSSRENEFYIHSLVTGLPHILPLAWASSSQLATLRCPYTLKSYVKKFPDLEPTHYKKLLKELLTGLFYLHKKQVVHCDIKPENIFITDKGSLEIGDFGLSSIIGDLYSKKGSPAYLAPEIVVSTSPLESPPTVTPPRDIWAVGIVIWVICIKKPFTSCREISEYITFLRSPYLQELVDATIKEAPFPPDFRDLLKKMLRANPKERITAEQALAHPYFNEIASVLPPAACFPQNLELARFDLQTNISYLQKRLLSQKDAEIFFEEKLIPLACRLSNIHGDISSLSSSSDKTLYGRIEKSCTLALTLLISSFVHSLSLRLERSHPTDFPFTIPYRTLTLALNYSKSENPNFNESLIGKPCRVCYSSFTDVIKMPSSQKEYNYHFLVGDEHPNILEPSWAYADRLATPCCPFTLETYFAEEKRCAPSHYKNLFYDLLSGLAYLSTRGIIHCNIKPQSLHVTETGRVKIGHFRFSRQQGSKSNPIGPYYYMAPETLEYHIIDASRDIWAAGITIWEMVTKRKFFDAPSVTELCKLIKETSCEDIRKKIETAAIDLALADLLHQMLLVDSSLRITADKALDHVYFRDLLLI